MKTQTILIAATSVFMLFSCKDSKSYSELLDEEQKAVNSFLAQQEVITEIPADTIFETGENAPYYQLDEEGNVYMQVVDPGDRENNRAKENQTIYFRYTRASLLDYEDGADIEDIITGNSGIMGSTTGTSESSFRFDNYELTSTSQWGYGIQLPLHYLGIDCEVNLVVKSQYGFYSEVSVVTPYVYHLQYFPSKI